MVTSVVAGVAGGVQGNDVGSIIKKNGCIIGTHVERGGRLAAGGVQEDDESELRCLCGVGVTLSLWSRSYVVFVVRVVLISITGVGVTLSLWSRSYVVFVESELRCLCGCSCNKRCAHFNTRVNGCSFSAHFNTRGRCYVEVIVSGCISVSGWCTHFNTRGRCYVDVVGSVLRRGCNSGVHISIQVVVSGCSCSCSCICVSGRSCSCSKWCAHFNTRDRCFVEVEELVLRCGCSKWWAHFNTRGRCYVAVVVVVRGVHISIQGVECIGWVLRLGCISGCISGVHGSIQGLAVVVKGVHILIQGLEVVVRGCIIGVHISIQGLEESDLLSGVQISIQGLVVVVRGCAHFNTRGRCYVEVVVVVRGCIIGVHISIQGLEVVSVSLRGCRLLLRFNAMGRCYVEVAVVHVVVSVLLQYKARCYVEVVTVWPFDGSKVWLFHSKRLSDD
ncbi:hypothetical protein DPMN_104820 [Dreissena polymorpha]|uniref:Uncharacterized protein n=1 Tax=Dreissena polymorpha TaxID=45954 RepID=A0A9D4HAP6_DREPO|nr:hypothetical protein DPMN_104820 [Dreissena polymorpha]